MWVLATAAAPQQPITTGSPAIPLWLWVMLPVISLLLTAGLVALAYFTSPLWRDRKAVASGIKEAAQRQKATQDVVLGCPADWNTGTPEKKGMVREFAEFRADFADLKRAVGPINGNKQSLMQMVTTIHDEVKRLKEERSP